VLSIDDPKGGRAGLDDYAAAERGKSRGGTRGGKPNQKESGAAAAGLAGFDDVPPNLDSEIQLCDGTEATTQSMLGSLISKPKLTDKLLQKPPFRFLYDIIMQVIETTEFGKGLYFGEELDSANISEKDKKVLYLEKMIRLVGQSLGTIVEAKPAKIVAGQDPQSTNNFLQLLSIAARHIKNSAKTVRIVLEQVGQADQSAAVAAPSSAPINSPSRAQAKHDEDDTPSTRPAPAGSKGFAPPSDDSRSQSRPKERDAEETTEVDGQADSKSGEPPVERSMRPTTARRRPPKVKDGAKEVTAKDVSAPVGKRAEGILIDGQGDDDDEDVPEESRLIDDIRADTKDSSGGVSAPQSKLVKDIMSRQVEQEAAAKVRSFLLDLIILLSMLTISSWFNLRVWMRMRKTQAKRPKRRMLPEAYD
jgi:TRAF3-interacting protein 1